MVAPVVMPSDSAGLVFVYRQDEPIAGPFAEGINLMTPTPAVLLPPVLSFSESSCFLRG